MKEVEEFLNSRRQFLKYAALGIAVLGGNKINLLADTKNKTNFVGPDKNSRIDIENKTDTIIQKAYDLGYQYEKKHRGCARCTVAALQDAIDFVPVDDELFRAASCLDGGATPDSSASCGAFTGSGMIIGYVFGTERFGDNSLAHELIHKVHRKFVTEYGSVICKNVRKSTGAKCPEVVAKAAKWTAEILLNQYAK